MIMSYVITAVISAWFGFALHCFLCAAKRGDEQGKAPLKHTEKEIGREG